MRPLEAGPLRAMTSVGEPGDLTNHVNVVGALLWDSGSRLFLNYTRNNSHFICYIHSCSFGEKKNRWFVRGIMSSTDRLAAFRARNKSLLDDLRRRQQQSNSVQQSGNTPHHTAGGEPAADAEGFTDVGNRRPARTAHSVTFAADLTSSQSTASRSRERETCM